MSSKKNLASIAKSYPKKHIVAASAVASCLLALMLLPTSEKASASRTQFNLALPLDEDQNQTELTHRTAQRESVYVPVSSIKNAPSSPQASEAAADIAITPDSNTIEYTRNYTVENGDTLALIFKKAGFTPKDVYHVAKVYEDATRLHPGEEVSFAYDSNGDFKAFKHQKTHLVSNVIEKQGSNYQIEEIVKEPTVEYRFAQGTINSSLFIDAKKAGLNQTSTMNFANIFGWDIDFVQDLRQGDSFSLMYEELYLDGESIGYGDIVAAEFVNQGNKYQAIRHEDEFGRANYYTPDGKSMRKAFLRSPIDFARISSHFNLRRKHPVLNKIRAHRGTDYAAGTGTPIRTAGDGKVIFAGWKGGYGRCVIIQHGQGIQTLYAHMSKFNKKTKKGARVSQGQVIGYVGATGMVSGPHLHYEFRVNGVHKNPVKVKLPEARPIAKKYRSDFLADASKWLAVLESNQRAVLVAKAD
jgi:murein DD-endopeptidase MepM/ murein hydrolase activator NlpD